MTLWLNIGAALLTVLSAAIWLLAAIAWLRSRSPRMLLLAIGFLLFLAGAVWTSVLLFGPQGPTVALAGQSLFFAAGLFIVYMAAVKR